MKIQTLEQAIQFMKDNELVLLMWPYNECPLEEKHLICITDDIDDAFLFKTSYITAQTAIEGSSRSDWHYSDLGNGYTIAITTHA